MACYCLCGTPSAFSWMVWYTHKGRVRWLHSQSSHKTANGSPVGVSSWVQIWYVSYIVQGCHYSRHPSPLLKATLEYTPWALLFFLQCGCTIINFLPNCQRIKYEFSLAFRMWFILYFRGMDHICSVALYWAVLRRNSTVLSWRKSPLVLLCL